MEILLRAKGVPTILFPVCLPLQTGDCIKAYIDLRVYSGGDPLPIFCKYKEQLGFEEKAFKIEKLNGAGKVVANYEFIDDQFKFRF